MYANIFNHAASFASHLEANVETIHEVLRKYQSKQVVDDEIQRSVDALRNLSDVGCYFVRPFLSESTAVFMPLNLPLYSFVLFGAMPAYQSASLTIRAPERMREVFQKLAEKMALKSHYPNIQFFHGSRDRFISDICQSAAVVIFTGRQENFLHIQKVCGKNTLVLYNGVGHNPIVVTPSADLDLAVKKALHVKLFNNGQDCAGPDSILVHSSVADGFTSRLLAGLKKIRCDVSYANDETMVGPLFEASSLPHFVHLVSEMRSKGATVSHGGQIDLSCNLIYPCVVRAALRQLQNFTEIYSPLFCIAEYEHDCELALYFDDPNCRYQANEMYISLFGESDAVLKAHGSIVLKNCTIHDVERGTCEYGGYSPGASQISYKGVHISKPLLIPREIHNFLSLEGQNLFGKTPKIKGDHDQQIIAADFQENVRRIFGDQLVFAYIFGSFATRRDKRHSDIDTLVCVKSRNAKHIDEYLGWVFKAHEMFGRIPDFKYPAEIVTTDELQVAVKSLPILELSATQNSSGAYDAMVWCHSLSQPWVGELLPENVPSEWKQLFPAHGCRLLRSFLGDLEKTVLSGLFPPLRAETYEIPRKEPEVSHFIDNLKGRGLLNVLKMIPFDEQPAYADIVLALVAQREFIGRKFFEKGCTDHLYNPYFRFGVVADFPAT
jgi:lysyl-tRNA synthetase class 1